MSYKFQIDPPAAISNRTMLDLNSGGIRVGGDGPGMGVDWGVATSTLYESQQGQYGNAVADWVLPNRTVTISLILGADYVGDEETLRSELQQKVGLLKEEGGVLLRQRAGGPAMYADIVNADVTIPDIYGEGGAVEDGVQLVLECLPDFYGDEITLDTIHCTGYCDSVLKLSGSQAAIQGDYPGRCQIRLTDTSGIPQEGILWAFRSRHYSAVSTAASHYNATDLNAEYPAAPASLTGSYTGTAVTYTGVSTTAFQNLLTLQTTVASVLAPMTHVGTYAIWVRAYSTGAGQMQLTGPSGANDPAVMPAIGFYDLNLGIIRNDPAPSELPVASAWSATIAAIASAGGTNISIDQVWILAVDEASGVLAGTTVTAPDSATYIRHDGMFWNGNGVAYPVPIVRGDLARIPPSRLEGRAVELFIKPSLAQYGLSPPGWGDTDSAITTFDVQVTYRPAWLSRP